ncbi:MAG TPA: HAD family hydrolase [Candidatus Saccharimonadales bacterium]|nr:HAD family hydrolase [Candidatus Saccharimonadales bacterium]
MDDYDAYFFDWDGTLAQTFRVWMGITRKTLTDYGLEATDKEIVRNLFGRAPLGLPEYGVPKVDLPQIFAEWDKSAQAGMPTVPLYPGAKAVLDGLTRRGKHMALITSTVRPTVELTLKLHGLEQTFAFLVTGSDVTAHKPDPEGILYALDKLGVAKGRAVMLGDSEKDIRAANNAGIDSILYFPDVHKDFHNLEQLQADKPTYTIHSWQEFLDQLQ